MFYALEVAKQIVRELGPILARIAQHDRSLAQQGREAGSSILMCTSEGARRVGRDRPHLYRVAAGSAGEMQGILFTAVSWGYITDADTAVVMPLLDRELGLLWGLTHPRR